MDSEETCVLFRHPSPKVRRKPLREFWSQVTRRVGRGCAATCLITTDRELRALNRRFRGEDRATDVLSFTNEIAISLDRASAQAAAYGHSVEQELRVLMLHGALHLAGMDHETDSGEMARAESAWRRKFDLPPVLTERAGPQRTHA